MSEFGAEKGLLQGHVRYFVPKNPGTFQRVSANHYYRSGERKAWLAVANFLVSENNFGLKISWCHMFNFPWDFFLTHLFLTMCYLFPQICRLSSFFFSCYLFLVSFSCD